MAHHGAGGGSGADLRVVQPSSLKWAPKLSFTRGRKACRRNGSGCRIFTHNGRRIDRADARNLKCGEGRRAFAFFLIIREYANCTLRGKQIAR